MKWKSLTLGQLCEMYNGKIQTGPFGSQLHQKDYRDKGTPVVMPKDIVDGSVSIENIALVNDDVVKRLNKHKLHIGDIVFPRRGDIGKRAFVNEKTQGFLCGTGCLKISIDSTEIDNKYLFYYLSLQDSIAWLDNNAVGSTMKNLSGAILKQFPLQMPPKIIQSRIASILSTYDDLIENNLKRIRLLEEAAQRVYREWFVEMRFPGWEEVECNVDSRGLKLPAGWQRNPIEAAIEFNIGGGWGNEIHDGEYTIPAFVIRGTDIPNITTGSIKDIPYRFHTKSNISSRKLQENDIVFEVSGGSRDKGVGRTLLISKQVLNKLNEEVICASFCKLIRVNNNVVSPLYFYSFLNELFISSRLAKYENQSASNIINFRFVDFISSELIIIPPIQIRSRFDKIIGDLFSQIQILGNSTSILKEARDILLPRLMDGRVEV